MDQHGVRTVLLTGATGFVGRNLWPALVAAGYDVRCLTRNVDRAKRQWPERSWVQGDLEHETEISKALSGCEAAFYLVHGMADGRPNYRSRELSAAGSFARAAEAAGLSRIVYLGGPEPEGEASLHLATRLDVGRILRTSAVPTIELRAAMIVGHGSVSWLIVRDLAARLPVMVLPRWLRSRSRPVALDDVVVALVRALDVELGGSTWYELPGPEELDGREILKQAASAMGLRAPLTLEVPLLSLRLSAQWIRFVTHASWSVAREIVLGLRSDVLPRGTSFWPVIAHEDLEPFEEAARRAIAEERARPSARGRRFGTFVESALRRGHAARPRAS